MKRLALAGVALLAMSGTATAGNMLDGLTGWGELNVGGEFDVNVNGTSNGNIVRGGGGFGLDAPVSDGLSLQLDGFASAASEDGCTADTLGAGGGLHGYTRGDDGAKYGIFAFGFKGGAHCSDLYVSVGGGFEGQWQFDDGSLALQVGAMTGTEWDSGSNPDNYRPGAFMRGLYRHFYDDNMMVEGGLAFAGGGIDGFDSTLGGSLSLKFEHVPDGWPVSYFAQYTGSSAYQTGEDDVMVANIVLLGVRFYFGHETLRANDRDGASLPGMQDIFFWNSVANSGVE